MAEIYRNVSSYVFWKLQIFQGNILKWWTHNRWIAAIAQAPQPLADENMLRLLFQKYWVAGGLTDVTLYSE